MITGGYKGLHGVTRGYRGLQWVTGGYGGLRGATKDYRNFFLARTWLDTLSSFIFINKKVEEVFNFLRNSWKNLNFAFFMNRFFYSL